VLQTFVQPEKDDERMVGTAHNFSQRRIRSRQKAQFCVTAARTSAEKRNGWSTQTKKIRSDEASTIKTLLQACNLNRNRN